MRALLGGYNDLLFDNAMLEAKCLGVPSLLLPLDLEYSQCNTPVATSRKHISHPGLLFFLRAAIFLGIISLAGVQSSYC